MLKEELIEKLLNAHQASFDIERDHEFGGRTFAGYAELHAHGEQYVLSRRAKLWQVDMHQYLFFDAVEHLDERGLDDRIDFMRTKALDKVEPHPDHMSSDVGLIVLADAVDQDAAEKIRRTRFRKNYKLGLQGWSDLKLAAVDLATGRVITNAAGKDLGPTLEANTRLALTQGGRS